MNTESAANLIRQLQSLDMSSGSAPPSGPPLNNGGDGDRFPSMEPRIAKLEAHMEHVRTDLAKLADVPAKLASLEVKVDHLPTKEWTFKSLAALLVALSVIVGLIIRFVPHA